MTRYIAIIALTLTACGYQTHTISGPPGKDGEMGPTGAVGATGPTGADGIDGVDGVTGPTGAMGPTGDDGILGLIKLCPHIPGAYPEYLIRTDYGLIGVYFGGGKTFLANIIPGNWVTTDGRNCHFTVTSDLEVIY
jgi:hypothetical protein